MGADVHIGYAGLLPTTWPPDDEDFETNTTVLLVDRTNEVAVLEIDMTCYSVTRASRTPSGSAWSSPGSRDRSTGSGRAAATASALRHWPDRGRCARRGDDRRHPGDGGGPRRDGALTDQCRVQEPADRLADRVRRAGQRVVRHVGRGSPAADRPGVQRDGAVPEDQAVVPPDVAGGPGHPVEAEPVAGGLRLGRVERHGGLHRGQLGLGGTAGHQQRPEEGVQVGHGRDERPGRPGPGHVADAEIAQLALVPRDVAPAVRAGDPGRTPGKYVCRSPERPEDPPVHLVGGGPAGDPLDDQPGQDVVGVRVGEGRARRPGRRLTEAGRTS